MNYEELKKEGYYDWAIFLARNYTLEELQTKLNKLIKKTEHIATSHLNAIEKSTSMQSNSQHRAQTGNSLRANYEEKTALKHAIEIKQLS
jgi:hypothetical protein